VRGPGSETAVSRFFPSATEALTNNAAVHSAYHPQTGHILSREIKPSDRGSGSEPANGETRRRGDAIDLLAVVHEMASADKCEFSRKMAYPLWAHLARGFISH
jgi:hypothetical protein